MGLTKAEIEAQNADYHAYLSLAHQAEEEKDFQKVVDWAVASWDHIDGMLRFERKYHDVSSLRIGGILIVLRYAPLLMDFERLDAVAVLLRKSKRIANSSSDDLRNALAQSRQLLQCSHRLWGVLEDHGEVRQDELRTKLGGDQAVWRSIAEDWENMGLVRRRPVSNSYWLEFVTRFDSVVRAKCSACGVIAKAAKGKFLSELTCPKCKSHGFFVIAVQSDPR